MFNIFSGMRRDTVVGILHVMSVVFPLLGLLFTVMIAFFLPGSDHPSVEAMVFASGIFLFGLFAGTALFGLSFVVEDTASLARAASQSEGEESESPRFESRVKEMESRERTQSAAAPSSNGEDDEKFMISVPRPAPVVEGAPPPPKAAPTAEAGKCFESVKTYVDLEMWPLAYQKAQELLQKFPDSPEAAKVRKNLEYIRQRAEEIEVPGPRR